MYTTPKCVVTIEFVGNDCCNCDDPFRIYNTDARYCRYCSTRLNKQVDMDIQLYLEDTKDLNKLLETLRTKVEQLVEEEINKSHEVVTK